MKISAINTFNATKLNFSGMNSPKNISFNGLFQTGKTSSKESVYDKDVIEHAEILKKNGEKTAKSDAVKLRKEGYDVLKNTKEFSDYCQSVIKNKSEEIEMTQNGTQKTYSWIDKDNNQINVIYKNSSKGYAESIIEVTEVNGKKNIILETENGYKVYKGFTGNFKDGYEAEKVYKYGIPIGKTKDDLVLYNLSENIKKNRTLKSADRSFRWDLNKPDNVKYITEGIKFTYRCYTYTWPGFVVEIDKRYIFDNDSNNVSFVMENVTQNPRYDHRCGKDYEFNSEGKLINYCVDMNK